MKKRHTTSSDWVRPQLRLSGCARAAALAIAAVAGAGAMTISSCTGGTEVVEQRDTTQASTLFADIPQHGASLGDPAAPITLTELSDLRCSHCRSFAERVLPVLIERYVRPGHLRVVLRNLPILGDASVRAARAAIAAGDQDRMWQFVHVFFATRGEGAGDVSDAFILRVAEGVPDLDVDRVIRDRSAPAVEAEIADALQFARDHRVRGVPTILIGRTGERAREIAFRSSADPDEFIGPIEELLASEHGAK